jgi:ankyrin repeat protein
VDKDLIGPFWGRRAVVWLISVIATTTLGATGAEVPLIEAVRNGDIPSVRSLLAQRVDVNVPDVDGTTALHWAVHHDDAQTVDLLIRAGATVAGANRYGATPLALACLNGHTAIVERLLEAGADPNTTSPEGETVLMTSARTGRADVLEALLARGANVHAREGWRGQTALMWAAMENHAAAVETLIAHGADVHARSNGGFTALLFAARAGHVRLIPTLLARGANVNDALPDGTSVLHLAILNAHFELAARLLDNGANPNAEGPGWTPLHQLVWTRRPNLGRTLLPPVPTGSLDTLDLAEALLAHGADPNLRQTKEPNDGYRHMISRRGATPFLLASKAADVELMRFLLAHGANPTLPTTDRTTPLMAAAGVGIYQVGENPGTNEEALQAVKLILELGADVNAVDAKGDTALHGAAFRGANDLVRFLVEKGARLDVVNKRGWTPLAMADGVYYPSTFVRRPETAQLLRELGAK